MGVGIGIYALYASQYGGIMPAVVFTIFFLVFLLNASCIASNSRSAAQDRESEWQRWLLPTATLWELRDDLGYPHHTRALDKREVATASARYGVLLVRRARADLQAVS